MTMNAIERIVIIKERETEKRKGIIYKDFKVSARETSRVGLHAWVCLLKEEELRNVGKTTEGNEEFFY